MPVSEEKVGPSSATIPKRSRYLNHGLSQYRGCQDLVLTDRNSGAQERLNCRSSQVRIGSKSGSVGPPSSMSALPPKAEIGEDGCNDRSKPQASDLLKGSASLRPITDCAGTLGNCCGGELRRKPKARGKSKEES
jgi:hypothetical protein